MRILIIGQGIAGSLLSYELSERGHELVILDDFTEVSATKTAAGLLNPVTGRKKVKTWLADELFPFLHKYYTELEEKLGHRFYTSMPIYKPFSDVKDMNDVTMKSESAEYRDYLNTEVDDSAFSTRVFNDYGGTEILKSGWIDTNTLLGAFSDYFRSKNYLRDERFEFEYLSKERGTEYKDEKYDLVIFCEGYKGKENPYFKWLPFSVTKGEVLSLQIDDPVTSHIINKGIFILPNSENQFTCGSTYELTDAPEVSEKGKNKITSQLDKLIKSEYAVTDQRAGIRPTVKDRRPLIGMHPELKGIGIFNGLGTKGLSLGPYFASQFADFLTKGSDIAEEANIRRFFSLYYQSEAMK